MEKIDTPEKIDPRVRRTRQLLREAMVSLVMEKDYGSITIKDIAERADVAYMTFYRHFESLDDLLLETLEEGLTELMWHIGTVVEKSDASTFEEGGRLIFEYIQQKADLFHVLFRSQSIARVRKRVVQDIAATYQKTCVVFADSTNPMAVDILTNHVATGLLALIEWWLDNHQQPAPRQMGKVYRSLIIDSTVGALNTLSVVSK